ncbi:MAG: hypothetical protein ACUVXI_10590 [bacterium]
MKNVIEISFDVGEPVGDTVAVDAGGRIRGSVLIRPERDIKCKKVTLVGGYTVRGAGTHEGANFVEKEIHRGAIRGGEEVRSSFDWDISEDGPISYQGHYIKIEWFVEAKVDAPLWRDPGSRKVFLVRPRRI